MKRYGLAIISILTLVGTSTVARHAWAQPSAEEVLAATDFSADDKQRILAGETIRGSEPRPRQRKDGSQVDVLISGTAPGVPANLGTLSRTLLQNIEVLSAGQNIQKDAPWAS